MSRVCEPYIMGVCVRDALHALPDLLPCPPLSPARGARCEGVGKAKRRRQSCVKTAMAQVQLT